MIIVLIAAAVVSGITSAYTNESFADVFIILFVVIINALLGMYQESKAEKAIEALKEISAATSKVLMMPPKKIGRDPNRPPTSATRISGGTLRPGSTSHRVNRRVGTL